jgi:hypothetical protein
MNDHISARTGVTAAPAPHHWQAKVRLVIRLCPGKFFLLLSYDDGTTVIHDAIDASGTVGGDWWGQVHATSLADALVEFARENALSIDALQAAIRAVETPNMANGVQDAIGRGLGIHASIAYSHSGHESAGEQTTSAIGEPRVRTRRCL